MIVGAVLAFTAALLYGVSDFYGAIGAARLRLFPATAVSFFIATLVAGAGLLLVGGVWSTETVLWAALAGVANIVGMLAFYRAMVVGPVSLVSPLIGAVEASVPVIASLLYGQLLPWTGWVAVALAIAAVVLMSLHGGSERLRLTAGVALMSLVSGIALGLSVVSLDRTRADAGIVPAFVECLVSVLITVGFVLARPPARLAHRVTDVWPSVLAGALVGLTDVLLIVALQLGDLAEVGVLVSLYPLSTLLLAWLVSKERVTVPQGAGIALALAASVLFSLD